VEALPSSHTRAWQCPPGLRVGDTVGVCAPAGAVEPSRLASGVAALQARGFDVRVAPNAQRHRRFNAGSVEERVHDLQALLQDPAVRGIFCARGGAGAAWLLPHLDVSGLPPKVFVGYSDITFLHLFLQAHGWVTFHGPLVAWELATDLVEAASFEGALQTGAPLVIEGAPMVTWRRGAGEGRLLGGCLTILAAAAGTPWALRPSPEGSILFLEEVDERPYRIDRLLYQLRASGGLAGVQGIVFGEMKGCHPAPDAVYTLEDVVLEALAGLDVPIAFGLPSGHTTGSNITLPLGVRARLLCGAVPRLETLESSLS
jgi:muramoyltetrapeptide carboxypeptidase